MNQPMSHYPSVAVNLFEIVKAREEGLPLMSPTCRSQILLQPERPTKVFLFVHGFTATPSQFLPIGRVLFEAGYNVLIPRMPGHGLAGDWNSETPPPLPETLQPYQHCCEEWLQWAQDLGDEVIVGGLSSGGTLAAWLALTYPNVVSRALLFAAYWSGSNVLVDLAVRILDIYFEWRVAPDAVNLGYEGFSMPALRIFLDLGQEILDQAEHGPSAPMLILSSDRDLATSPRDHQALFQRVRAYQPLSWYHCFDESFEIPHNMMTQIEGNAYADMVFAIAKAYVESDLTWTELNLLCDRVAQGEAFETVVMDLGWTGRVVAELQTLVRLRLGG